MKKHKKLVLLMLLTLTGCEFPHESLRGTVLGNYFVAIETRFPKSGKVVSLRGQEQYLRTVHDTLWVYRGDSTFLFLPDYRENYELGSKKDGIIILEADTPDGLKSVRIKMGEDYRQNPNDHPITLGQVVNGKYDAKLDTIQTLYDIPNGPIPMK